MVEVVDHGNGVALTHEPPDQCGADKASSAEHDYLFGSRQGTYILHRSAPSLLSRGVEITTFNVSPLCSELLLLRSQHHSETLDIAQWPAIVSILTLQCKAHGTGAWKDEACWLERRLLSATVVTALEPERKLQEQRAPPHPD